MLQRADNRGVGPFDFVRDKELVVIIWTGDIEIKILEEIGERPAIQGAKRQRRDALFRQDIQIFDEIRPGRGRVFADIFEHISAPPSDALRVDRADDAVKLAINRAEIDQRLTIIVRDKLRRKQGSSLLLKGKIKPLRANSAMTPGCGMPDMSDGWPVLAMICGSK